MLKTPRPGDKIVDMTTTRFLAFLFVFALIASACGSDDDSADMSDPGEATESQSSDNGSQASPPAIGSTAGDARADAVGAGADFPIPIPAGWLLDQYAELEAQGVSLSGGVALEYANEDFDTLVVFYDEWTAEQPDEYVRGEEEDTIVYTKTSPLTQIFISKDFEGLDGRFITLLTISTTSE